MIQPSDILDALNKATAYSPDRVPAPSEATLFAWVEHFAQFPHLTRDDLLEAVRTFYREPHERLIQPADISKIARDVHQDHKLRENHTVEIVAHEHDSTCADDEHPPGDPCAADECRKPSTFAQYCARHYALSLVGLVGKTL